MTRTYLEWLVEMPWVNGTEDKIDIQEARNILNADHYDLEKVKKRILEYLAVRKLKADKKGPILCLVGPPGVGKTSLGKSIDGTIGRLLGVVAVIAVSVSTYVAIYVMAGRDPERTGAWLEARRRWFDAHRGRVIDIDYSGLDRWR